MDSNYQFNNDIITEYYITYAFYDRRLDEWEIQIGEDLIDSWYFSSHPEEFNDAPVVYIYEEENIIMFEIDGERQ
ncbi:hypothetical protein C1645_814039 [Glomus cerebriforme]|uniref:Tudor-knot domain-containing protein n=1 Tax=Glomus cerebriforme TaxID=658196 RepID=A0A397TKM6_9GLOM|nr:hypothetical protein C1645_814039 [Glomus cerebriforme]